MKHKKWVPYAVIVFTVLLVIVLMKSRPEPARVTQTEKSWSVNVESLRLETVEPQLTLLGRVETPNQARLVAAVTADVKTVSAQEGSRVQAGQLLVELDPSELSLQVQQRQADVAELEALIQSERHRQESDLAALENDKTLRDLAQREVDRQQRLVKSKLASEERLDAALSNLQQAELTLNARRLAVRDHGSRLRQVEARRSRALALLKQAELDLERTQVKAPFAGTLSSVSVAPGDRLNPGQAVAELYDSTRLEVRAQIPDRWVAQVRDALEQSQVVQATGEFQGRRVSLQLDRLSGRTSEGAGGLDGLFRVINDDNAMVLGRSLNVRLNLPPISNVYTAPLSALYGTRQIYTVENGRLQSHEVTLLGNLFTADNQQRLIFAPEAIAEGANIVTTQLPQAISGLKVDVRKLAP